MAGASGQRTKRNSKRKENTLKLSGIQGEVAAKCTEWAAQAVTHQLQQSELKQVPEGQIDPQPGASLPGRRSHRQASKH